MKLKSLLLLPLFALLLFTSCQDEVTEIIQPDNEETFETNSQMANLLRNVSMRDGSIDNIIDGASKLFVNLPVKVYANSEEINVNTAEDYSRIEANFDANEDDEDILEIEYPITVTLRDHSQVVVNSRTELNTLRGNYPEEEDDDDIECIDFQYPISFSIYDSGFQIADVVTINSDLELFLFIQSLEPGVFVKLNFPVTMVYADDSTIEVNNHVELIRVIIEAIHTCDEDDDNDYNDDDFTQERLENLLKSCPWVVKDFRRDDINLNNDYEDYIMFFNEDNEVQVRTLSGDIHTGTWETEITNAGAKITLSIDTLTDFNLVWFVYEIEEGKIKLHTAGGNRIILKKTCDISSSDCPEEEVDEYLYGCHWNVVVFDGSDDLIEYELSFHEDQKLWITTANEQVLANWSTSSSSNGGTELSLTEIAAPNIQAITGNWNVVECSEDRLEMINTNNQTMVIEKNVCYDEEDFANIITECPLEVSELLLMGADLASQYTDNLFHFYENGMVVVTTGADAVHYGTWETDTGINGNVIILLNIFGLTSEINDYYQLDYIDGDYIKLSGVDGKELKFVNRCDESLYDEDAEAIKGWLDYGVWQVTYFVQEGEEKTEDFNDIEFNFQENNSAIATNVSAVTPSEHELQYEVLRDNSQALRFIVNYLGVFPYYEIHNDWYITEVSENRIELRDVNEPNDTQNVLVLEKIE